MGAGIENRITYDPDEITRLLENQLDKLKVFRFDSRYRSLLGESFINLATRWEKDILSRRNDPFTLVVCGEFKRGKSSLINALLGEDVTPVNVTPETVTLNRIIYGPHSNEAVLPGGKKLQLSDEEMQRENLEALMRQTGFSFRQIELQRPVDFLKQTAVVDTPGLGDSMQDFGGLVEEALAQADAVVYVFSVNYPLSQTEQLFLKTMIVPQKYTDLLLVGNYLDVLNSEEDYERMRSLLVSRIQNLLPGQEPWLLSALDERCRQLGEERPNPQMETQLGERFDRFREELMHCGVAVLDDETMKIHSGDDVITLAGIQNANAFSDLPQDGRRAEENFHDRLRELAGQVETPFSILLSHRPDLFEWYVDAGFSLTFCGHAHGGQMRIPGLGGVLAPNQGFFGKYTEGLPTKSGRGMNISRGLGNSGFPFRVFNRPEMVLVTLRQGK